MPSILKSATLSLALMIGAALAAPAQIGGVAAARRRTRAYPTLTILG